MPPPTRAKPLRKDAARNRLRILEAAERVFAERGLDASIDDIAAEVGVGVGTIYRRFGSKAELIDAVFEHGLDTFLEIINECAANPDAWEGLCAVMSRYVVEQSRSRAVQELLYSEADAAAQRLRERVEPLLTALVERAQVQGALRADFAATDIPVLTHAASSLAHTVPGYGPALARRHIEIILKGIAATPDPRPIPGPLADDDFADWLRGTSR